MILFSVTYDIVTEESSMRGDIAECGFEVEDVRLRDAIEAVQETRTSACDGVECIEANDSRIEHARWITITNGMEYETGDQESRSLHIPDHVSGASRKRIAKLLGAYGT